ncbi:MAG: GNAT family N-acetyltransferase [Propioniciclava sp.]
MRRVSPLDSGELGELVCPGCGRTPGAATFGLQTVRDGRTIGMLGAMDAEAAGGFYPRASIVITQLWVRPEDRGELVGTQLVQRLAAQVARHRIRCIVAHGTYAAATCQQLPAEWLEQRGFVAAQARGQWRLDLRRTVWVPHAVRVTLQAGLRALHPERPAPASRDFR